MEINQALASYLAKLLAEVVSFKFVAQGFHWNVKGIQFNEFHEFFGDIYEDAEGSVDSIGENIRKLNYDAPCELKGLMALAGEMEVTYSSDPAQMSVCLYQYNEKVRQCLVISMLLAEQAEQQGILNFLSERFDQHTKWQWQLRTIIGDSIADAYEIDVNEITDSFLTQPYL